MDFQMAKRLRKESAAKGLPTILIGMMNHARLKHMHEEKDMIHKAYSL